jgi:hypothetical protein
MKLLKNDNTELSDQEEQSKDNITELSEQEEPFNPNPTEQKWIEKYGIIQSFGRNTAPFRAPRLDVQRRGELFRQKQREEAEAKREITAAEKARAEEVARINAAETAARVAEYNASVAGDTEDKYGIKDLHRDAFTATFGLGKLRDEPMSDAEITKAEDSAMLLSTLIGTGGMGMPKTGGRKASNVSMAIRKGVDISRALRSGDKDRMIHELAPGGYVIAAARGSGTGESDRQLTTYVETPHDFFSGGFGAAAETMLVPGIDKEEEKPILERITRSLGMGNLIPTFSAASEYDKFARDIAERPWIKVIEEDRYYTVRYDPVAEITYIEWKPTEDVRSFLSTTGISNATREWSEDALAALGRNVPAWTRRVEYVKAKYGKESGTTKHYGYSRGGGLATHMGGTGFGAGYFSKYAPSYGSKSKRSGDFMHDYLINPVSVALLMRNLLRV